MKAVPNNINSNPSSSPSTATNQEIKTNTKTPSERIKELKELLLNDLISKDEFELKKKLIIDEL